MYNEGSSRELARRIASRVHMKRRGSRREFPSGKRFLTKPNVVAKLPKRSNNRKCCSGCTTRCCSGKVAVQNYRNFAKSALPRRLMYFSNGAWKDYPLEVAEVMKRAFARGMSTTEIKLNGMVHLIDFLRMLQIDLRFGIQRSIAWIDVNGKCFFPKLILEEDKDDSNQDGEVGIKNGSQECETYGAYIFPYSKQQIDEVPLNTDLVSETSKTDKFGPPTLTRVCSDGEVTMDAWDLQKVPHNQTFENVEIVKDIGTSYTEKVKGVGDWQISSSSTNMIMKASTPETPSASLSDIPGSESSIMVTTRTSQNERSSSFGGSTVDAISLDDAVDVSLKLGIGGTGAYSKQHTFECLGQKLIKLSEETNEYMFVKRTFLAGLCKFASATAINLICKNTHTSIMSQTRLQAFHNRVNIVRSSRGNANIRNAWYGASRQSLSSIILHGFSSININNIDAPHGRGVYLAAEDCSYLSAKFSDAEQHGERYALLCRVILGNVEEVPYGSDQFHPSSEKYDSGVDNISNPKNYIIWSTHMNTHILPEYIVSFKVLSHVHETWAASSQSISAHESSTTVKESIELRSPSPTPSIKKNTCKQQMHGKEVHSTRFSPLMSFIKLFSVLRKFLPESDMRALEILYAEFKSGRIGKDILIKKVRMIVGDKLLITAIQSIQHEVTIHTYTHEEHIHT
eukprot:TRINITY_DN13651_c0_g1_i10.p1 TRINITY_DN13651_c0_g1~~TRINITY_DN13651_c0_g1_i10.p1  ORF type:complete len:683 (+),score=89.98 TRINITY_DN13651_c0_g1_i10:218-2266(+)